ncbi:MAG: hypothetical protein JST27_01765 [Bacteroidetes bacterium]|nr:hypothetical protein [Bacteroidota bacterium]
MKYRILQGWHLMRFLRLAAGLAIVAQGIYTHDWIFIILGGLFSLLPLFNVGCCGTAGCRSCPPRSSGRPS